LIEIVGDDRQMMQAALHDKHVFAGTLKRKLPAIADVDPAWTGILRSQGRRQVYSFDLAEAKLV
jgi:hypothetical protein